jgi:hypothetical protein
MWSDSRAVARFGAHLEADDVPLLPLDVELVELVQLRVEDAGEPVGQVDVPVRGGRSPRPLGVGGGGGRRRERRGRCGLAWHQVLDELLEGLVGEVLVPPRRQRLLQVVPEILPELHHTEDGAAALPHDRRSDSSLLPSYRGSPPRWERRRGGRTTTARGEGDEGTLSSGGEAEGMMIGGVGSLSGGSRTGDIRLVSPRRLPLGACVALPAAARFLFYFIFIVSPLVFVRRDGIFSAPASDLSLARQEIPSCTLHCMDDDNNMANLP